MVFILQTAQHPKLFLVASVLVLSCAQPGHFVATGQEPARPPAAQTKAEQDLTDGLLDLLTQPATKPVQPPTAEKENPADAKTPATPGANPGSAPTAPTSPSSGARGLGAKDFGADDLGDGEDLGAQRANPLAEVQLGMLTAAGWLREQSPVDKTEELQRDIVARLDQLIADLNQQSPGPPPPPPDDSQSPAPSEPQQSEAQQMASKQAEANKKQREQQTARKAPSGEETQADASGTEGQPGAFERKGVVVDLNDPAALQRSAWGNLPDRVREQMQSRMVERFLPGYREDIEAYYRALSR